jgi:hypothetical protein
MDLPQDIQVRLERRWLARHNQVLELRKPKKVLNESEVTSEKTEGERTPRIDYEDTSRCPPFSIMAPVG